MSSLKVLQKNQHQQQKPRRETTVQIILIDLKVCSRTQNLERGKEVHREAIECGLASSLYVASALINMYSKCGRMVDAHQVFNSMTQSNVVSWTALIMGYADVGDGLTALDMFLRMRSDGFAPDCVCFVAILKACIALATSEETWVKCRDRGKALHNLVVENGCILDAYVQSTLIEMFSRCGCMVNAHQVFDTVNKPNLITWTTLILGYAENGQGHISLNLFKRMATEGVAPDSVTFVAALKACKTLAMDKECKYWGQLLHNLAVDSGFSSNMYVQNILIDMYAKCGSMMDSRRVFDSIKHPDVVCWTALIFGYAESGEGLTALELFGRMKREDSPPNPLTFVSALKACTSLAEKTGARVLGECRDWGRAIHNLAENSGTSVQNTLIDMYAKCGCMVEARQVFDSNKCQNVVSWTSLILGYVEAGEGVIALDLFMRMKNEGPAPDLVTFSAALKACALLGALETGREIHAEIDNGHLNVSLVNCLVDFYAKCACLVEAESVFNLHARERNNVTWNVLLGGYSSCGDSEPVFRHFAGMQDAGFKPDSVTFLSILSCCRHAGLVEKGEIYFKDMSRKYGILPTVEHYTCMMDIFGRANKLDDAMSLLQFMPCGPDSVTWMTLLDTCRAWKNVEIGRLAFQSLSTFDGMDAGAYVLMGQIYESRGMLQEQELVLGMKRKL